MVRTLLIDVASLSPIAMGACLLSRGCLVAISVYLLHRETHSENVTNADICTKHVQLTLLKVHMCLFMFRNGAYADREAVFSTAGCIAVQTMSLVMLFVLLLSNHST